MVDDETLIDEASRLIEKRAQRIAEDLSRDLPDGMVLTFDNTRLVPESRTAVEPDMKLTAWQRVVVNAVFDRSSRIWCPACIKDLGAQRHRVGRMHSAYRARRGRQW